MRTIAIGLALLAASALVAGCCCPPVTAAREAAKRASSDANMHNLGIAMARYRANEGKWPDSLDEIAPFAADQLDLLLTNPVTGDEPGYEYVRPEDSPDAARAVVLYQLRGGRRDLSLSVLYGDGHVGPAAGAP